MVDLIPSKLTGNTVLREVSFCWLLFSLSAATSLLFPQKHSIFCLCTRTPLFFIIFVIWLDSFYS